MQKYAHICLPLPFNKKLSRGEISMANFKPPMHGRSLDSYLLRKLHLWALVWLRPSGLSTYSLVF